MKRHLGDPPTLVAFSVFNQRATAVRMIGSFLAVFISACLAAASVSEATQAERPRYVLPVGDKPGYVNTIEYQLMPNPKEAAALLLKEAALAQTNIDRIGLTPTKPSILVGSGPFTPDLSDDSFVRYATDMASRGFAEADTVCLIKIARGVSIREFAEILGLGVQIYRDVPSAFIGRVPFGVAASLLAMPVVEWIGVFEPRHKISPHPYVSGKVLHVETLIADEQLCRADLAKIGAEVHSFSQGVTDRYAISRLSLRLEPDRLNELAAFWWVQVIGQESEYMNHNSPPSSGGAGTSILAQSFRPYDSRRLLSLRKANNQYDGDGETLLVLDSGTWWDHPALKWRVVSEPVSNAPRDSLHGTHVSGIAVGEWNPSVTGGGIGGVAPGARLVSRERSGTLLLDALQMGLNVANFSFGSTVLGAPVFTYNDAARFVDDSSDNEHDVLVIASAGNLWNPETVFAPALAKNALAVGSINYVPADTTWEIMGRRWDSSSQGPTAGDLRLKPDLVAPGGSPFNPVVSCKSPCCVGRGIWHSFDGGYVFLNGTSMAAPHVSGAALIVQEWYRRWTRSRGLESDPNYARTSELIRALLINTAIPLRANGDSDRPFPRYASDNTATPETLKGFANTEYGFGLVNPYSGVVSPESDYWRALIWQDEVVGVLGVREMPFNIVDDPNYLAGQPRYLVATMVYDDVPAVAGDPDPLKDKLEFSLIDPAFNEHKFALPFPLKAGTAQKIIIPNPSIEGLGIWKAKVYFSGTTDTRGDLRQRFAVVVDVMEKAPKLSVTVTEPALVKTNTDFVLPVTIKNVGGNVAAGVTVAIEDPDYCFRPGSPDTGLFYVGNLPKGGDSITRTFKFRGSFTAKTCSLIVKVDTINKMMDGGPYPIRKRVILNVRDIRVVRGEVRMLPGFNQTVEGAEVLVDGVPSGKQTQSDGTYAIEVEKNFSGTIRPRKGTTIFIPPSKSYATEPVADDRNGQDYEATYHTITGFVDTESGASLEGITVTPRNAPGSALRANGGVTDSEGRFTVYVEHGWTGRLEPQPSGQYATFSVVQPQHAFYDSVVTNVTQHNFTTRPAILWPIDGVEIADNATSLGNPEIVADGFGGAIVVWPDSRAGPNEHDIYAQRLDVEGSALWGSQEVSVCSASGVQDSPTPLKLPDGSVVVFWRDQRDGGSDLYAQRLSLAGARLWATSGVPVCTAAGDQTSHQAAVLSDGSILIVWEDRRSGNTDIFAQRLALDGSSLWTTNGVPVCAATGAQLQPRCDSDGQGGAYLTWEDHRQGTTEELKDVYVQRINASGAPLWMPTDGVLVSMGGVKGKSPALVRTSDGSSLVAFFDGSLVRGQKVTSAGAFGWPLALIGRAYRPENGVSCSMLPTDDGGAILAWKSSIGVVCNGIRISPTTRIQRISSDGSALWSAEGTDVAPGKSATDPRIVSDGGGGAYVSWRQFDDYGCVTGTEPFSNVYVQRFDSTGCFYWKQNLKVCGADGRQQLPAITSDLVSGCFVAWHDARSPGEYKIYTARINDTPQLFQISGTVREQSGAGVRTSVVVLDGSEVTASRITDSAGRYVMSLAAFSRGTLAVEAKGYLNTAAPAARTLGPITASTDGLDFTLSHTKTRWRPEGLAINSSGSTEREMMSVGSTGDFWVAWENLDPFMEYAQVRVQRVTPDGDIQWTQDGDPVVASSEGAARPIVFPAPDGHFLLWRNSPAFEDPSSGVWAQRITTQMVADGGPAQLTSSWSTDFLAACPDGAGGAFVTWYDLTDQNLYMQRVLPDGTATWPSPLRIGFGALSCPPILESDGQGGVLACWRLQFSGSLWSLNVQRIDETGNTLWGGPEDWSSITVRSNSPYIPEGAFRVISDDAGGAHVVWNERSGSGATDDRIRVNWVGSGGTKHLGANGVELTTSSSIQYVADVARPVSPWHWGFLLLYVERDPGVSTSRLQVQQVLPGINEFLGKGWGEDGKTVGVNPAGPWCSRMLDDEPSGGASVFWCDYTGNLYAQCVDSLGARAWTAPRYRISRDARPDGRVTVAKDGAGGAYVTWHGLDGRFKAARVSEAVFSSAEVTVSSFVRDASGNVLPMAGHHANGCPKGDQDDILFRVELRGDLIAAPASSSIVLVPPPNGSVVFHRAETADSTLNLSGDCYQTTITVSEFSGCGEDSAEVRINDWVVGHARFRVRSPDANSSTAVNLGDFALFTTKYPSTKCNCIHPKDYDACFDYVAADTTVDLSDFASLGAHYNHELGAGQSPLIAESTGGEIALSFEEVEVGDERRLRVRVALETATPFVAGYIALRNENPIFEFAEWKQDPTYANTTLCAEIERDGRREIAIGLAGPKQLSTHRLELGWVDLIIPSDAPLELTNEDLQLITGEILSMSGNPLGVSVRGREFRPVRYENWLAQNYPNPFNPTTTISFSLAKPGPVSLRVYDVTGALVRTLVNGSRKPNVYKIVWDGTNNGGAQVASGVYFYKLKAPEFTSSKKMVLLK